MLKKTLTNALVLIYVLSAGIIVSSCASNPDSGGGAPVLGTPTPLQVLLNALPPIPIPGNTLKFEFGGEAWIAKRNGADFFGGSVTFQTTSEGVIFSLKQTHIYTRLGWIPTPGPEINLEYIAGPPSSLSSLSASDAVGKIASAQAAGLPSSESIAQADGAPLDIAIDMDDYTGELPEDLMKLDEAIALAAKDMEQALPQGTVVAVINFTSVSKPFSDYVLEELTGELVSGKRVAFVDRVNQAFITQEMNLQTSADISDDRLQGIGRTLGAKSVVSGSLTNMGAYYRFRVRVINVENAEIQAQVSLNLQNDTQVATLMRSGQPTPTAAAVAAGSPGSRYLNLSDVQWNSYVNNNIAAFRDNSSVRSSMSREYIDGQQREVLTLELNLPKAANGWWNAGFSTLTSTIVQQMRGGSGIRFKALGDGKKWDINISTFWGEGYTATIAPRNGRVVEIDIPYSKLKKTGQTKENFDKTGISRLDFQRNIGLGSPGDATLKIFDFEVY